MIFNICNFELDILQRMFVKKNKDISSKDFNQNNSHDFINYSSDTISIRYMLKSKASLVESFLYPRTP